MINVTHGRYLRIRINRLLLYYRLYVVRYPGFLIIQRLVVWNIGVLHLSLLSFLRQVCLICLYHTMRSNVYLQGVILSCKVVRSISKISKIRSLQRAFSLNVINGQQNVNGIRINVGIRRSLLKGRNFSSM